MLVCFFTDPAYIHSILGKAVLPVCVGQSIEAWLHTQFSVGAAASAARRAAERFVIAVSFYTDFD